MSDDAPTDYAVVQVTDAPPWLQRGKGGDWLAVTGLLKDAFRELAKRAVKARYPGTTPPDGLDRVASNFQIERDVAPTDAQLVAALKKAWESWESAGTKPGLLARLVDAGYVAPAIYEASEWDPYNPEWWRFWVVLRPPYPWTDTSLSDGRWGDAGTWSDGGAWAQGIPPEQYGRLRRIVHKWKPTHARCAGIILLASGELFGTRPGTWATQSWSNSANAIYLEA